MFLPMEGLSVWLTHGTQRLHQTAGPIGQLPPRQEHVYVPIHKRYLSCASLSFISREGQRCQCPASSSDRFSHQPCQVLPSPSSGHDTPWSRHRELGGSSAHPSHLSQKLLANGSVLCGRPPTSSAYLCGSPCHGPFVSVFSPE